MTEQTRPVKHWPFMFSVVPEQGLVKNVPRVRVKLTPEAESDLWADTTPAVRLHEPYHLSRQEQDALRKALRKSVKILP